MPLNFECGNCGKKYRVGDENAGRVVKCKQCRVPFEVPTDGSDIAISMGEVPPPDAPVASRPDATQSPGSSSHLNGRQSRSPNLDRLIVTPMGEKNEMRSRKLNVVFLVGISFLLIGFVLPWISIPGNSMSGGELPILLNDKLDDAVADAREQGNLSANGKALLEQVEIAYDTLYLLYIIPLLCILALIQEFIARRAGRNAVWLRTLVAVSPVIAFTVILYAMTPLLALSRNHANTADKTIFDILGIGFWLTVIGMLVTLVSVFTSPKPKSRKPQIVSDGDDDLLRPYGNANAPN